MARRWLWHKSFDQGAVFILVGLIAITAIFQILFITKTRNMDVDPSQIFFQHPNPPRTTPTPSPPPPPPSPTPPPTTTSPILSLIKKAIGNDHDINSLLTSTSHLHHLPSPTEVNHLYTSTPHIHGLETCPTYRAAIPKHLRFIAPAGTMNTGTNLLSSLLHRNCHIPSPLRHDPPKTREAGIRFQAPWGKHHPPSYRNENVARDGGAGVIQDHVLPVVMIKDPLTWMSSMCVHRYGTVLEGGAGAGAGAGAGGVCGRLVGEKGGGGGGGVSVTVPYAKGRVRYDNWIDLWNTWYKDWMEVTSFPRIFVRYEDLIFHAEETIKTVCDCAGGEMKNEEFRYREDSAKGEGGPHKGGNGFVNAVMKYGNETFRDAVLTRAVDRDFFRKNIDYGLMRTFGYADIHED